MKSRWKEFLHRTEKEPVTRVKGKRKALRHLDKLKKKSRNAYARHSP